MKITVLLVAAVTFLGGCAGRELKRQNEELRTQLAALTDSHGKCVQERKALIRVFEDSHRKSTAPGIKDK